MSLIQRGPGEELWTLADTLLENTWHKRDQYEFVALTAVEEIDNPPLQLRCDFTFTAIFRSYFVSTVFPGANAPYFIMFHLVLMLGGGNGTGTKLTRTACRPTY